MVYRIYSEKKSGFNVEASSLCRDLQKNQNVSTLSGVRIINRYDVENIEEVQLKASVPVVFSEPPVDNVFTALPPAEHASVIAVEYLPGQYDQRADSCEQCLQLQNGGERPTVRCARIFYLYGNLSENDLSRIRRYLINPVESREASLAEFETLKVNYTIPTTVETVTGFTAYSREELEKYCKAMGLAMDEADLEFLQNYFRNDERRDPTVTEIRLIDTYWSDHCRHTTFSTHIDNANIAPRYIKAAYEDYRKMRSVLGRENKPETLMDIATIGTKWLKHERGKMALDESEEINACSIRVPVKCGGREREYLMMFKNETHNHPTEIEPFGGAATCLGGAIRDPLSGRSYVYQAMRVTGAGDPRTPVENTLPGKLPQRYITNKAAAGYSSYGNQIGLATGMVNEVYHEGYVAKRMEIGAVIGAAPADHVVREAPVEGDIIVLLGGRTGRDGCGGATGSSKSHDQSSLSECGAEVQKGNPLTERKLQRLFRDAEATRIIKRCNDFGAGGVSVAVGELADGLDIDLDAVPKKYDGLDGTELAISESQERMAVVIASENVKRFFELAHKENLEATVVARVTSDERLRMSWNGNTIVDISREFLNTNGASRRTDISVSERPIENVACSYGGKTLAEIYENMLSDLNICSQQGLSERFDSTIGAASVLMPFGGKRQLTPTQAMAAVFPSDDGLCDTASVMSYGFDVNEAVASPYHGAMYALTLSAARAAATGADDNDIYFTLQEYFPATKGDPKRWGLPFEALLGALKAQAGLGYPAIGGKDSMSGSFENIDVPPTLVSFAAGHAKANKVISPEFKQAGSRLMLISARYTDDKTPDFVQIRKNFAIIHSLIAEGKVLSCTALASGGIAEAVFKATIGNNIGTELSDSVNLTEKNFGGFIYETTAKDAPGTPIGVTIAEPIIRRGREEVTIEKLFGIWRAPLAGVFPTDAESEGTAPTVSSDKKFDGVCVHKNAKPVVFIPVFPGTNCEIDTARAFSEAGAEAKLLIIRNLSGSDITDSVDEAKRLIDKANIIALPGGFSGGDEPEGSGKFISAFFRNASLSDSIEKLLYTRDGLMLGICNGFQALVKLGLLPFGHICPLEDTSATLTFNAINRHQSMMVHTRIAGNASPWLNNFKVGDVHVVPISHGEGRFVADASILEKLREQGQIATQYADLAGVPSMETPFNPNGSVWAIEGILSPDGRILGKMGHSERKGANVGINVPGDRNQDIFSNGVNYFIG